MVWHLFEPAQLHLNSPCLSELDCCITACRSDIEVVWSVSDSERCFWKQISNWFLAYFDVKIPDLTNICTNRFPHDLVLNLKYYEGHHVLYLQEVLGWKSCHQSDHVVIIYSQITWLCHWIAISPYFPCHDHCHGVCFRHSPISQSQHSVHDIPDIIGPQGERDFWPKPFGQSCWVCHVCPWLADPTLSKHRHWSAVVCAKKGLDAY